MLCFALKGAPIGGTTFFCTSKKREIIPGLAAAAVAAAVIAKIDSDQRINEIPNFSPIFQKVTYVPIFFEKLKCKKRELNRNLKTLKMWQLFYKNLPFFD